jgi:hypothetical protein
LARRPAAGQQFSFWQGFPESAVSDSKYGWRR